MALDFIVLFVVEIGGCIRTKRPAVLCPMTFGKNLNIRRLKGTDSLFQDKWTNGQLPPLMSQKKTTLALETG